MKLGHIGIPVSDLASSRKFYDGVANSVCLEFVDSGETSVRYGVDGKALFYLHTRGKAISGVHICFEVETRDQVDEFHRRAIENGGQDFGSPGVRQDYSPTYYAAFALDPDGNNIEAVCRR